jgi:hypothetical protein
VTAALAAAATEVKKQSGRAPTGSRQQKVRARNSLLATIMLAFIGDTYNSSGMNSRAEGRIHVAGRGEAAQLQQEQLRTHKSL